MKKRVFSGIKPSGNLHLGNYLGALKNWVALQHEYECLFCVADMHAITVWQDPKDLAQRTYTLIAGYLASGIDPEKNILFLQSHVPAHAELGWILSCVARMGWMNRMTQFKEKSGKDKEKVSLGLYAYPALMAADILLYKAELVPVGEDQKQHVELTRDIAQKFNHDYQTDFFPLPETLMMEQGARIMSLRDGTQKMGKSDTGSDYSCIYLTDSPDTIAMKIRKAKTDPHPLPTTIEEMADRPEAKNLLQIYAALTEMPLKEALTKIAGRSFSDLKEELIQLTQDVLNPIQEKMNLLLSDKSQIEKIQKQGAEKAKALAEPTLKDAYQMVGFLP